MNRQIRRVGVVLMLLFVALFLQLNYLQVIKANAYKNDPRNTRIAVRDFTQARGQILAADGTVLARSVPKKDSSFERLREYPEKDLFAEVTGYFSFTYGSSGAERQFNDELAGRNLGISSLKDVLVNREVTGDVVLTVRKDLQQLAKDSLANRKGAVVAIEPSTGNILAFWSYPSFDPNALSQHNQQNVRSAWTLLNLAPDKPMLARAYRETYPPGSTFKVVTSAATLERKPELATKSYPVLRALDLPGTKVKLPNFGNESCGGTLPDLLRVSCNTGFGQMAMDLGAPALHDEAVDWGFDSRPPIDLPAAEKSVFPDASSFAHDQAALAKSGIGQQDVRATPLQMASIAAGVANGGVVMKPHVLSQVRDSDGNVVRTYEPSAWTTGTTPEVAGQLRDLMISVVQSGTGTHAQIPGATVGGKTGTAETTNGGAPHAWFIGFADANGKSVAVAVIVESQPGANEATGGTVAAPIAQAVMRAALGL